MTRSALRCNFHVNPFSSHAADVFHYFTYIYLSYRSTTNLDTLHVERCYWYAWQQNIIVSLTLTVLMY